MKWSDFFNRKKEMVEPTCEKLYQLIEAGKEIKYLRMDNAGENLLLEKQLKSNTWKLGAIVIEYTARNTPQQNNLAELGFAHLANYGRALMVRANVPLKERYRFFTKAFQTATLLDGFAIIEIDGVKKTRYDHYYGDNPKFVNHLRTWGEAGTVTLKNNATPKAYSA